MIERTNDMDLVTRVMTDPCVYPYVTDDGSPNPEEFEPVESDLIYYLLVLDYSKNVLGLFLVHPQNSIMYEIHTCLLRSCRGLMADEAARLVLQWIFNNTPCQKLITHVPAYNKPALDYAKRSGFTVEGNNSHSFLKNGKLHDQVCLGIKGPELCQQQ